MENIKKRTNFSPWLVISLAAMMLFYKYLLQVFPSVITNQLMSAFQLTGTGLGNLAACFFYSYLVMQFFSGYLIDRFNMRYIICLSILISATGALFFGLAHSFSLAVTGRILMGIGAAFATVGYIKTASLYFRANQFALVSGLLTVGVMLGAVFGEAPLALLIKNEGWHQALLIIAAIGAVISLLFFIVVKNKPNAEISLAQPQQKINFRGLSRIFTSRANWYLTLYSGLAFAPLAVFGGLWGTPFITKAYGITQTSAAAYTSIVYIGFGLGGPLFGYFSDRYINRFNLMSVGLLLSLLSLLGIIYFHPDIPMLIALTFLFGLSTGAFMLGFTVGKDINPIYMAATVVALINSGDAICGALSEPLIGKLLDLNTPGMITIPTHFPISAYHLAFITLPIELLLAFAFLHLAKQTTVSNEKINEQFSPIKSN